jgi:hypothetical protein
VREDGRRPEGGAGGAAAVGEQRWDRVGPVNRRLGSFFFWVWVMMYGLVVRGRLSLGAGIIDPGPKTEPKRPRPRPKGLRPRPKRPRSKCSVMSSSQLPDNRTFLGQFGFHPRLSELTELTEKVAHEAFHSPAQ